VLNSVVVRELNHRYTHSGEYPHRFNNGEKLSFPGCNRGLLEFPILTTGVYVPHRGVDPGADRVVYTVVTKKGKDSLKYALHTQSRSVSNDVMNCCSIDIADA
jgi:hypothetical protein